MTPRIAVSSSSTNLLRRIAFGGDSLVMPTLPPVVGGQWGGRSLDDYWGPLRIDGPSLVWERILKVHKPRDKDFGADELESLSNKPAELRLADGRTLAARIGVWTRSGGREGLPPGETIEFNCWMTRPKSRAVHHWIGRLQGVAYKNGNLTIASKKIASGNHLHLIGNYNWYLLDAQRKPAEPFHVVISTDGAPLDQNLLGADFRAMEFAMCAPLQLDTVIGLDEPGNVIACAGLHLGGNRSARAEAGSSPVPDDYAAEHWIPTIFRCLAKAMVENDQLSWGVACGAFLDSATDPTVDTRYMKLHIALEKFATVLLAQQTGTKKRSPLVKDPNAWTEWVKSHAAELAAFVAKPDDATRFVDKVRSAMNPPSSNVVTDALARLVPPLDVGAEVAAELELRNVPAHHYVMIRDDDDYDVDRETRRIDMLRTVLVALVARACGYDGPISGWERRPQWKPTPAWWPKPTDETIDLAREIYSCEAPAGRE